MGTIGPIGNLIPGLVLGLQRELADRHVLDHSPPQRADALITHGILLSELRLLTSSSSDRTPRPVTRPVSPRRYLARSALPRERFRSLAHLGSHGRRPRRLLVGVLRAREPTAR